MGNKLADDKISLWRRFIDNETVCGYLFALPFLIGFFGLTIFPMIMSLYLSFTNYDIVSAPDWIGLRNYIRMFTIDTRFTKSLGATAYFVFASVPLKVGFALIIAFLLTRKAKMMGFYRALYYLPSLIGGSIAVAMTWKELFASRGVINTILEFFGYTDTIYWLGDRRYAIWVLISLAMWQFGSSMIIFAAGLKQIPESYYEAATIDGGSKMQQFYYITLPVLSPVIFFNLVMQTIGSFMTFTQAFVITGGGPMDSTMFYALYLYVRAFNYFDMGYASAMAWFLLIVVAAVTGIIFKSSKYWVYYESRG